LLRKTFYRRKSEKYWLSLSFGTLFFATLFFATLFLNSKGVAITEDGNVSKMTLPRVGHTVTLFDHDQVLVAGGGYAELGSEPSIEVYDLKTFKVARSTTNILARSGHTSTLLNHGLVAIAGGSADFEVSLDAVEIVELQTLKVLNTLRLNTPRSGHGAFLTSNGSLVVVGGFDGQRYLDSIEILEPGSDQFILKEHVLEKARGSFEAKVISDKFIMTGGLNFGDSNEVDVILADAEVLDMESLKSEGLIPMESRRAYHSAISFKNELYVFGGISDFRQQISSIEKVDLHLKKSFNFGNLHVPRSLQSVALVDNKIVLVGGTSFGSELGDGEVCQLEKGFSFLGIPLKEERMSCERIPKMLKKARWSHKMIEVKERDFLVFGGMSYIPDPGKTQGGPTSSVELTSIP
jgi:hypothetical protein